MHVTQTFWNEHGNLVKIKDDFLSSLAPAPAICPWLTPEFIKGCLSPKPCDEKGVLLRGLKRWGGSDG